MRNECSISYYRVYSRAWETGRITNNANKFIQSTEKLMRAADLFMYYYPRRVACKIKIKIPVRLIGHTGINYGFLRFPRARKNSCQSTFGAGTRGRVYV